MISKLLTLFIVSTTIIGSFFLNSCDKTKSKKLEPINIRCERIVLQDTVNDYCVHFLVSFENKSNDYKMIYANSVYKGNPKLKLKKAGIILKIGNQNIPLGHLHSSSYFVVKPNSTLKLPYTYSKELYHDKINHNSKFTFYQELKNSSLEYIYDKKIIDSLSIAQKEKINNYKTIEKNVYNISLNEAKFQFNNNFSIEDIIKLARE